MVNLRVIKWENFPRYWPFERGIHWSPVGYPWANTGEAGVWDAIALIMASLLWAVPVPVKHPWRIWISKSHESSRNPYHIPNKEDAIQNCVHTLKRKCIHFDEILITGCTGSCPSDNFQCSQWWKFRQNNDIFVSVYFMGQSIHALISWIFDSWGGVYNRLHGRVIS